MSQIPAAGRRRPRGAARRVAPWLAVTVVAALVAMLLTYRVTLTPPGLHPKEVVFATAEAQVFVDSTPSELLSDQQSPATAGRYQTGAPDEAQTLALWVQGEGPLEQMAAAAGQPGKIVDSAGPYTETLPDSQPTFPKLVKNDRLLVDVDGVRPMITLYAQAPTERAAVAIVNSARSQLIAHVAAQGAAARLPAGDTPFVIRSLGSTTGGVVDPSGKLQLIIVSFGIVFLAGAALILSVRWRAQARLLALLRARTVSRPAADADDAPDDGTDLWPHTRRFLPWSLAVFVGALFLVPIDAIFANNTGSSPLSPTPDRIMLAIIGVAWLVSLRRPGPGRPRLRFTRVHAVFIAFIGILFLSVGLSGHELSLYGQVMPSVKKLFVVVTWATFFVIAASVIRPGEVRPFLKLIVGLGVLCALGTLFERSTHTNLFYDVWSSLHVPMSKPVGIDQIDDIGRLSVVGPTNEPLELATLLSLVLCPAIIFTLESRSRRERGMWLLATMIVMAGALATSRKTSVVAPVVGIGVLTAYRPRKMARGLALAIVPAILVIHVLAPGQLGSVISELEPANATKVNTDKVRVQRYDAVRPDVMSHIIIGDGYSSYTPQMFRFLDNEYLGLLITAGALGMVGLLALFAAMFTLSHPLIRGPDRRASNAALAIQAMVAMVMVCCALFDTLSFDHVTYMLLLLAAMLIAMHKPVRAPVAQPAPSAERAPVSDDVPDVGHPSRDGHTRPAGLGRGDVPRRAPAIA